MGDAALVAADTGDAGPVPKTSDNSPEALEPLSP